uniref:Atypical chemokine receptor 2 n=1 Tax=Callorhinchus milii TaxID=7868 RepID=A0A4W3HWE5_CALMI|eukprot:gi/632979399/ref/XP_007906447.1/ PREDICTED: atypical chemokine receptor 2 [Callorhinchus milii]
MRYKGLALPTASQKSCGRAQPDNNLCLNSIDNSRLHRHSFAWVTSHRALTHRVAATQHRREVPNPTGKTTQPPCPGSVDLRRPARVEMADTGLVLGGPPASPLNGSAFPEEDYNYTDYDFSPYLVCAKDEVRAFGKVFLPVLYVLVFTFGALGNSLLGLVLIKYIKLTTMTDVYLLNLAISDFLFAASLPFWAVYVAHEWVFGSPMCKVVSALYSVNFYSSIFFITCMSFGMYLQIVHTVSLKNLSTVPKSVVVSAAVWLFSAVLSGPELFYSESRKVDGRWTCLEHYGDQPQLISKTTVKLQVNVIAFVIPFLAMIFFHTRITQVLLRSRSFRKDKALKLVVALVIIFFVLWFPYNIVLLLHSLEDLGLITGCRFSKRLDYAMQVTESMAFTHCCINPLLYAFVNERFRRHLKNFLMKVSRASGCKAEVGVTAPAAERSETSKQHYGLYSEVEMTVV